MAHSVSLKKTPKLDNWISIGTNQRILVRTGKVDIGQRISTALALIAAEELDVKFEDIDIARTETGVDPDEGITSGSNSMEQAGNAVRAAAATARQHLLALAAKKLKVNKSSLEVSDGLIQSPETNQAITYWELAGGQLFGIDVNPEVKAKKPEFYTKIGKPIISKGISEIVTGKPYFVQDMRLPGMLHARTVKPPHYNACLKNINKETTKRLNISGFYVVCDGSFLAVAGVDEYAVIKSTELLAKNVTWDLGSGLEPQDLFKSLVSNDRVSLPVVDGAPQNSPVLPDIPDPPGVSFTLKERFERPYQMHGSIGPSASVALAEAKNLTIWTHSQGVYVLRASLAEALSMDVKNLRIVHVPGSGCYGHNGADDAAVDAAVIARAIPGKPILLKWTREEEHAWEPYGSCMVMDLKASIDNDGKIVCWSHETYSDTYGMRPRPEAGGAGPARLLAMRYTDPPVPPLVAQPNMASHSGLHRNLDPLYKFKNKRLVKNLVRDLPLRTSALRTLGAYGNVFAIESFMDELANAAQIDPVKFRLDHLIDKRAKVVLETAAEKLGWKNGKPVGNLGQGIAFAQYKNKQAYAAVAVELEVNDKAEVALKRAVIAGDAGQVVDKAGLTAQFEGGFLQAASWTLYEAVTYDKNGITSRDWESYPILRFDNIPEIETILIDRANKPFLGAGEAIAGPTAGAIANAINRAIGIRLRRLPFTPDTIRTAAAG